jgi:hypothetical protein
MENEEKNGYSFPNFLLDVLGIFFIIVILDMMGCDICSGIGSCIGDGHNAFRSRTEQVTSGK